MKKQGFFNKLLDYLQLISVVVSMLILLVLVLFTVGKESSIIINFTNYEVFVAMLIVFSVISITVSLIVSFIFYVYTNKKIYADFYGFEKTVNKNFMKISKINPADVEVFEYSDNKLVSENYFSKMKLLLRLKVLPISFNNIAGLIIDEESTLFCKPNEMSEYKSKIYPCKYYDKETSVFHEGISFKIWCKGADNLNPLINIYYMPNNIVMIEVLNGSNGKNPVLERIAGKLITELVEKYKFDNDTMKFAITSEIDHHHDDFVEYMSERCNIQLPEGDLYYNNDIKSLEELSKETFDKMKL